MTAQKIIRKITRKWNTKQKQPSRVSNAFINYINILSNIVFYTSAETAL